MTQEEANSWGMLVGSITGYVVYVIVMLRRAGPLPLAEVPYIGPMLTAIGIGIGVSILIAILIGIGYGIATGEEAGSDLRDREIGRFAEHGSRAFLVIGGLAALVLTMFEMPHFWIANAIYLGFVLSGVLEAAMRLVAYRLGFQQA